jgi:hypothetical protein
MTVEIKAPSIAKEFMEQFGNNLEGFNHDLNCIAHEHEPVYAGYRAWRPGADPKKDPPEEMAHFSFKSIQGCRAVVVSYNTWVHDELRGMGIGGKMQAMKDWLARRLKVSALICTTLDNNNVQNHHLKKFGWELFFPVSNHYTGNKLLVWVKKYEKHD